MRERDKDEIRHHIDVIFRAYIDKDSQKLEGCHAAEWAGFGLYSQSIVKGREAYMNDAHQTFTQRDYLDYEMVEIDYLFYDDVCVVPYMARARGIGEDGETFEIKLRCVEVYVQQDGRWQQVAANTSLHPDNVTRVA